MNLHFTTDFLISSSDKDCCRSKKIMIYEWFIIYISYAVLDQSSAMAACFSKVMKRMLSQNFTCIALLASDTKQLHRNLDINLDLL